MRIENWVHTNVDEEGNCLDELGNITGHVSIEQSIKMSPESATCESENCKCSQGHWLTINFGRNEQTHEVSGVTVYFYNWGEMQIFITCRELAK